MKNSASTFRTPNTHNALRDLQIPPKTKTQVQYNVSRRAFCGIRMVPPEHEK
jgi:hypothetical protein